MEKLTKEYFDTEDLTRCECGNFCHVRYINISDDGAQTCPECQMQMNQEVIGNLKKLIYDIADPALSKKDIDENVKYIFCKANGLGIEDFDLLGIEL